MRPHTPCTNSSNAPLAAQPHPSTTPPTLRAHARSTVFTTVTTPLSRSASATFQVRRQHGALSCTPSSARCPPAGRCPRLGRCPRCLARSSAPPRAERPMRESGAWHSSARRGNQHPNTVCASPGGLPIKMWQPTHAALGGNCVLNVECNILRVELPFCLFYELYWHLSPPRIFHHESAEGTASAASTNTLHTATHGKAHSRQSSRWPCR
jgi:hypothetical protein